MSLKQNNPLNIGMKTEISFQKHAPPSDHPPAEDVITHRTEETRESQKLNTTAHYTEQLKSGWNPAKTPTLCEHLSDIELKIIVAHREGSPPRHHSRCQSP
jgi:hypothetical protein